MSSLTELIDALPDILWSPVGLLFDVGSNLNIYYLATAALCGALFWIASPAMRARASSLTAFLLPRHVLLHRSALLDYRNYAVFMIVRVFYFAIMVVAGASVAAGFASLLAALIGTPGWQAPIWLSLAVATVIEFLLIELGYWIGHRLLHENPLLWEFHKTHHAAEVLTPATAARVHPVDDIVMANATAVFGGLGLGFCVWLFGGDTHPFTLLQYNAIYYFYLLTFFHLRHSHIWISFGPLLNRVLQSPAHHQIHHSDAPQHAGTNLGYCLAVWDWLFGTLHVPTEHDRRQLSLGIGPEGADYRTLRALFILPFLKAALLFRRPPGEVDTGKMA